MLFGSTIWLAALIAAYHLTGLMFVIVGACLFAMAWIGQAPRNSNRLR
jgi:hypothetical protein